MHVKSSNAQGWCHYRSSEPVCGSFYQNHEQVLEVITSSVLILFKKQYHQPNKGHFQLRTDEK